MTTFNLTCEAVEATLPDYLDDALEGWLRKSIEGHLGECVRCSALLRDLRNNAREAAVLPALVPELDGWPRIARRIGAPIIDSGPLVEPARLTPTTELAAVIPEPAGQIPEPATMTPEPPSVAGELPAPTSEPLVLPRETLVLSGTTPVPSTPPTPALLRRRERGLGRGWTGLAAAALVLVAAGTTFLLTEQWLGTPQATNVASETVGQTPTSSERAKAPRPIRGQSAQRQQVASDSSAPAPSSGQLASTAAVSATASPGVTRSPEEIVYDREINTLSRIVRRQKSNLDPSTIAVIEKNLQALDAAIAQIRAALQEDPGNSLLGGQASRALEMKVELLRQAAMLRSNS